MLGKPPSPAEVMPECIEEEGVEKNQTHEPKANCSSGYCDKPNIFCSNFSSGREACGLHGGAVSPLLYRGVDQSVE